MTIKELLDMQFRLDDEILINLCVRESKDITHIELLDKRFTALFVEVTEFMEAETREESLNEYADIMHFLLCIINTIDLKMVMFDSEFEGMYKDIKEKDTSIMEFIRAAGKLANATKCFKYWSTKEKNKITAEVQFYTIYTLVSFLQIGKEYGFSSYEIIKAYIEKNEINYKRQNSNY